MDRMDEFLQRLDRGQGLTRYEQLRLVMVAKLAAEFTDANDRSDDADERIEEEGGADSGDTYDTLLNAATQADEDYNRSKDRLFGQVRELMGWPGRPAKYLPDHFGGRAVVPHPFEQEGGVE